MAGRRTARSTAPTVRWSVGSNARSESISSPKNSIRIGSDERRREDIDDPAPTRGFATPGDLADRDVAEVEQFVRSASWRRRIPTASSRGAAGRSSGSIVCWRSAWTLATRTRARPLRHAARAATRAAVSSAMSSLRS